MAKERGEEQANLLSPPWLVSGSDMYLTIRYSSKFTHQSQLNIYMKLSMIDSTGESYIGDCKFSSSESNSRVECQQTAVSGTYTSLPTTLKFNTRILAESEEKDVKILKLEFSGNANWQVYANYLPTIDNINLDAYILDWTRSTDQEDHYVEETMLQKRGYSSKSSVANSVAPQSLFTMRFLILATLLVLVAVVVVPLVVVSVVTKGAQASSSNSTVVPNINLSNTDASSGDDLEDGSDSDYFVMPISPSTHSPRIHFFARGDARQQSIPQHQQPIYSPLSLKSEGNSPRVGCSHSTSPRVADSGVKSPLRTSPPHFDTRRFAMKLEMEQVPQFDPLSPRRISQEARSFAADLVNLPSEPPVKIRPIYLSLSYQQIAKENFARWCNLALSLREVNAEAASDEEVEMSPALQKESLFDSEDEEWCTDVVEPDLNDPVYQEKGRLTPTKDILLRLPPPLTLPPLLLEHNISGSDSNWRVAIPPPSPSPSPAPVLTFEVWKSSSSSDLLATATATTATPTTTTSPVSPLHSSAGCTINHSLAASTSEIRIVEMENPYSSSSMSKSPSAPQVSSKISTDAIAPIWKNYRPKK